MAAPLTMYDSVNIAEIPADAKAVAGYVNGRWPTYPKLAKRWPNAERLSIAVSAAADADCLDVERYDATPEQAPAWVKRQQARGVHRPAVYSSVSEMAQVQAALTRAGIKRREVRLFTAHYNGKPHLCTAACGFGFTGRADATQYTDKALGRSLDASYCAPSFFAEAAPKAAPKPSAAPAKSVPAPVHTPVSDSPGISAPPVVVRGPEGGLIARRPLEALKGSLAGLLKRFGTVTLTRKG